MHHTAPLPQPLPVVDPSWTRARPKPGSEEQPD
ncbi:hypothetical protein GA0115256_106026 [Streptomyces sp. DconLS]|uniref:Uncharacterized protein n=1 Tax=Streptomyces griseofuscus TaxID=146922 RepID=A0A7H1PS88_9ACTN|nr:hypothetical protein [Streptomyces murinus]QNT90918.1 hypothetical protein HEP81_00582 [Streptomyces griseofuscus]RAJ63886.1 hypothetical protein K376_00981 [Streptomyces sp. PsTaAH-130]TGZ14662.1 hypothetical protein DV517_61450 [Streptomyces sp. S816]SCF61722.1 hypothetical protein GA0115256_106026 [Streptomyces sp. DconLS]SCF82204.1 hypothetical protein GA0115258_11378 [Streptomyces sp. LamerLS-31b]